MPSEKDYSNDQVVMKTHPTIADTSAAQTPTVNLIPFNPEQMIQDCDDFSISSCEAQSFLDDDFQFVSWISDAFWEQGVLITAAAPTLDRQSSVSNVSLSSTDENTQTSTSEDTMQLSWRPNINPTNESV